LRGISYEQWRDPAIVSNALELLNVELPKKRDKIEWVELCFTTDPFMVGYPEVTEMSLAILARLHSAGVKADTLTKGVTPGDLVNVEMYGSDNFYGISFVSLDEAFRQRFEPFSAPYKDRIRALAELHDAGLKTWVAIEPYPTPNIIEQELIDVLDAVGFVDIVVFGHWDYNHPLITAFKAARRFYADCANDVVDWCHSSGKDVHILGEELGGVPDRVLGDILVPQSTMRLGAETGFSTIWHVENRAALKALIVAEVNEMYRSDAPNIDIIRATIPEVADSVIELPVPQIILSCAGLGVADRAVAASFKTETGAAPLCRDCNGENSWGCWGCCSRNVPMLFSEVSRLAKKFRMSVEDFITQYLKQRAGPNQEMYELKKNELTQACVLLTEAGRCGVHDARPVLCDSFPIIFYERRSHAALFEWCRLPLNAAVLQCAFRCSMLIKDTNFAAQCDPEIMEYMRRITEPYFFLSESDMTFYEFTQEHRLIAITTALEDFHEKVAWRYFNMLNEEKESPA
jgi:Fe-S-cluster containining protein